MQDLISNLEQQLGPLTWPLVAAAVLSGMILLERVAYVIWYEVRGISAFQRRWLVAFRQRLAEPVNDKSLGELDAQLKQSKGVFARGCRLLLDGKALCRADREEMAQLWLAQLQSKQKTGLKLLHLIGVVSPLIGLLGTVLGLIQMFDGISQTQGPVTPAMLSAGLALAMNTTAAGLLIALPALLGSKLVDIWSSSRCTRLAHGLTQLNLWLDGVSALPQQRQEFAKLEVA
ncbi:MotA/TolQ/ExbB proton channel family protein [Shewanella corallii]|uniref:MotA/TolQ/ExbB proton channel family protein n=1 Tax=Shewanella corallii TaxID=560080 RepID=A0ABT0N7L3_9GAMM|nr:MotA/TolQ/ExbB proton channel family protein [Shewanella corallii]MCL2913822.1 MotA/TolQ/ExbB proton channel family protein [Shewanella corallii]